MRAPYVTRKRGGTRNTVKSLRGFVRMKAGQAWIKLGLYEIKDPRDKIEGKKATILSLEIKYEILCILII